MDRSACEVLIGRTRPEKFNLVGTRAIVLLSRRCGVSAQMRCKCDVGKTAIVSNHHRMGSRRFGQVKKTPLSPDGILM